MHKTTRLSCLLAALVPATLVQAQLTPAPEKASPVQPKVDFLTVDRNLDGALSKEEAAPITDLEKAFDTLDEDHSGAISPMEFSRWARAGKAAGKLPDPATAPTGSAGAQHMPDTR